MMRVTWSRRVPCLCFQSRDWLQLRVLECTPELTRLGATLEEALQLQRTHHDVLLKLQVQLLRWHKRVKLINFFFKKEN